MYILRIYIYGVWLSSPAFNMFFGTYLCSSLLSLGDQNGARFDYNNNDVDESMMIAADGVRIVL